MPRQTDRRSFLKGLGVAGTSVGMASIAGCLGDDDPLVGETLRVGVLQPASGDLEFYGEISAQGFYSGLAHKFDVDPLQVEVGAQTMEIEDGPDIELIHRDTQLDPATAQTEAESLVLDDEVDVLFGPTSSAVARQLITEVVSATDVPLLVGPAADSNITVDAEFCHPRVFRASEHTGMDARAGAAYAAEETGVTKVAIFYADYSFGQSVRDNYREVLEERGVEVSPVRGVPQGYGEFEGLFDEAEAEGADGVVGGFTVATLPQFLGTAVDYDMQIFGGFADLLSTQLMADTFQAVLGEEFTEEDARERGIGPFTTRYHWNQYDNEINNEFIDSHVDAYDIVPDLFSSGTFTAASALVQAIEQAESIEMDDIAEELTGMTVEVTPKGENAYTFREVNNQAMSPMTVAWPVSTREEWAETWPAPVQPGDPVHEVAGEDIVTPAESMSCDLT
ncbi:MAG: ABC transporter substrate-binding protein [Halobacteriota archaeon]